MPDAPDAGRLALSSMWFQRWQERSDLRPFFEAGRRMGFRRFELSHDLGPAALASAVDADVQIQAVHHPAPRMPEDQASDSLLARAPAARQRAAAAIGRSLETAARLEASAVVLHLGMIEDDAAERCRRLRFELEARHRAGQHGQPAYEAARARLRQWLVEHERPALERALIALPPLLERAAALGLRLGLESGYHAHELPTAGGMAWLLDALAADGIPDGRVGAWLDTGHVGAREQIGLDGLEDWLGAVRDRWIGVHLHDLVGLRDHLVPGMGQLDFAALAGRLPSRALRTCELDWYFAPEEIATGVEHLRAAGWA